MSAPTRRAVLAAAGAGLLAARLPAAPAPDPLDAIARAKGMRFGSALGRSGLADGGYASLVARQCGLITPENEMKWGAVRPAADRFEFGPADALVGWATTHGLGVRGHNLLWQSPRWTPAWLAAHDFGANPRSVGEKLLTDHVSRVAGRYANVVRSYDVVNEAVDETGGLRETSLSRAIGGTTETVALAFHVARAAAPHAQLVYNDYMSWDATSAAHRAGVLRLLGALKAKGVPVDALGIQAHLGSNGAGDAATLGRQTDEWRRFLDQATGMGLALLVTEFDVNDRGLPADVAARDRAVADLARAYLDLTLSYRQVDTLVCWGIADRYSWLQHASPRADGLPKRPLPYDEVLRAKPLRDAIAASLRSMPVRGDRPAS